MPNDLLDPEKPNQPDDVDEPSLDPNDSELERDHHLGQTTEHAHPARLEDENQSGG